MSDATPTTRPSPPPPDTAPSQSAPAHHRPSVRRLIITLARLADLQSQILLLRTQLAVRRFIIFATLALISALLLVALVFIYIGLFDVITRFISPTLTFLLFGLAHLVAAAVVAEIAHHTIQSSDDENTPSAKPPEHPQ